MTGRVREEEEAVARRGARMMRTGGAARVEVDVMVAAGRGCLITSRRISAGGEVTRANEEVGAAIEEDEAAATLLLYA
jgi:hypothetical protein